MALTPSSGFLSFSIHRDGTWQLTRVRDWSTSTPIIDHLNLPGYFSSKDDHDLDTLEPDLFVTPDGKYAICTGTAWWNKRVKGKSVGEGRMEIRISAIDLQSFQSVNTVTTKTWDLLPFQGVFMRPDGQLVIDASSFHLKKNELFALTIPEFQPGPKCIYRNIQGANYATRSIPVTKDACSRATEGLSLNCFLASESKLPAPTGGRFLCTSVDREYCPQPDRFSPDGRLAMGIMTAGHDSFLGGWVQTKALAVFFSTKTHTEIDARDVTHSTPYLLLASAGGKEFLLTLADNAVLTVYGIGEG